MSWSNEYEVPCPVLQRAEGRYHVEGDRYEVVYQPCTEALMVTYETAYTLSPDDLVGKENIPVDNAHVRSWKLECNNGHVLATSDYQDENAIFDTDDLANLKTLLEKTHE